MSSSFLDLWRICWNALGIWIQNKHSCLSLWKSDGWSITFKSYCGYITLQTTLYHWGEDVIERRISEDYRSLFECNERNWLRRAYYSTRIGHWHLWWRHSTICDRAYTNTCRILQKDSERGAWWLRGIINGSIINYQRNSKNHIIL